MCVCVCSDGERHVDKASYRTTRKIQGKTLILKLLIVKCVLLFFPQAFAGEGQRLNGKMKPDKSPVEGSEVNVTRGVPNYNYQRGKITFEKAKSLNPHQPQEEMVSRV